MVGDTLRMKAIRPGAIPLPVEAPAARGEGGDDLESLRTCVANQAATLAEGVNEGFAGFELGVGRWRVELMTPPDPSTGGGARARQHIRLVPGVRSFATIVVGTVDPVSRTGEVRTYEHVASLHQLRFGGPVAISPEAYAGLLRKLDIVLGLARIRTRRVGRPADLLVTAASYRPPALVTPPRSPATIALYGAVVVLAVVAAFQALRTFVF